VQCLGQIESGFIDNEDFLYCRYIVCYGSDWEVVGGIDNGLSQTACQNHLNSEGSVVWNFPIDVTLKSTNLHGWPRIAISVYGMDFFGRDIIRGYGSLLVPLKPGVHKINVDMFKPIANSSLNSVLGWLTGNPPEFFDTRFVSQGEGREVTRVQSCGTVTVSIQVVMKGELLYCYCFFVVTFALSVKVSRSSDIMSHNSYSSL
jgi:B9 domain-containing protein 1